MRTRKLNIATAIVGLLIFAASLGTAVWRVSGHRVDNETALIESGRTGSGAR